MDRMTAAPAAYLRALARLVAVLALVVGVLSMHGLVAGGHASHEATVMAAQEHLPAYAAPALAVGQLDKSPHDGLGPLGLAVCIAVLAAAALLLRRAAVDSALAQPAVSPRVPRPSGVPPGRGPPRLLLAQLCVLRT